LPHVPNGCRTELAGPAGCCATACGPRGEFPSRSRGAAVGVRRCARPGRPDRRAIATRRLAENWDC